MIGLSRRAEQDFQSLLHHYARLGRREAELSLFAALDDASERIIAAPHDGLAFPRPYKSVARPGQAWIKSGRYWIGYSLTDPPVIVSIFHDTADIPRRL